MPVFKDFPYKWLKVLICGILTLMLLGGVNALGSQIPAEIWFAQARDPQRLIQENEAFEASFPLKCKLELKLSIW